MKGYKAFNPDLTCRGMQYEVGKSYFIVEEPVLCERGFHFCETLKDCSRHYILLGTDNRVCEVEASGTIIHGNDKCVTNQLLVVRELSRMEINRGLYAFDGDGNCYGNGNGYGDGDGYLFGDGDYYGDGNGHGHGNGYDDYFGDGDGFGDGYGHGNGYGNGDGYGAITKVLIFK